MASLLDLKILLEISTIAWMQNGNTLVFPECRVVILNATEKDRVDRADDCMLEVLGKWVSYQTGTGFLLRTWQTLVEAVRKT